MKSVEHQSLTISNSTETHVMSQHISNWENTYCTIFTRSSATAEKQRVSCAWLANWSCNAQNTAESQRLYYFWHWNALSLWFKKCWRERILSWN